MLLIVWQFRPEPGREAEFVSTYGATGAWAAPLDRSCEPLCAEERPLGRYRVPPAPPEKGSARE